MKRICVFCGSNTGNKPIYVEQARQLGAALANHEISIIYGGTTVGLMGAMADAALRGGGEVIGIIPKHLADRPNMTHQNLSEVHIVDSMHQRKAKMAELADGFIALPGGLGTLEELFEMLTWSQLGLHRKPCGILNVNGFYNKLIELIDGAITAQFIKPEHRQLLITDSEPETLIAKMHVYRPPKVNKWFDEQK